MSLSLLHSPADIVRHILIDLGEGSDPGAGTSAPGAWPVYSPKEPSTPDNVITIKNTTPKLDGRSHVDGEQVEHSGFQVRVRSQDTLVGYPKAASIRKTLNEQAINVVVRIASAVYHVQCVSRVSLIPLGEESPSSRRTVYTLNGLIVINRVS
jgi:hypothetical protein